MVGGGGTERYGHPTERLGDGRLSFLAALSNSWHFANDLDCHVDDGPALARHQSSGFGKQSGPGSTRPLGTIGAEITAEITQPRGRQQRIAHGMRRHVTVGVAIRSRWFIGPTEACHDHRTANNQRVHIDADAGAEVRP